MTIFRLLHSGMSGSEGYYECAYVDREVAELVASEMRGDWEGYKVEEVEAEELPNELCAVGRELYKLDRSAGDEKHRERALAKLTEREKSALGIELEYIRYALMTNGNDGANPGYKYWTSSVAGKLEGGAGCFRTFGDAVAHLAKQAELSNEVVHLVGIFDGITERGKVDEMFADIIGIQVDQLGEQDEAAFVNREVE